MDDEPTEAMSIAGDGTWGWVYAFANGSEAVDVTYSDIPGPWIYSVEGRMVAGKPAITRLAIVPRDPEKPQAITRETVRRAPTGTILGRVKSALRTKWNSKVADLHAQARLQSVKAGRSWPAEHFVQVAWFAVDAELTGLAPRQVIQDTWGVSGITASRWLARARTLGYLPDYPLTPIEGRPHGYDYVAATRILEEAIVQKVFREDLTHPSDPASVRNELWGILRRTILHDSKEAKRLRTEVFATTLAQLAVGSSDEQIQSAAQHLCDLVTSPVADLPTE
ncbi:hypothetical protein EES37_19320 [Streptomyces sp. ADI91-18]|uniref:hypothetical protein n=1 Tax=Streptomyces sp. ADI91-18 TaxID=1522755 RepID=UPI000F558378|nr:hypothetical protein [Streptomyces sp. ADI91-18]RPK41700.1 hypothetical protein EES37_19320 [Streptomyces sp. ADI91-18]